MAIADVLASYRRNGFFIEHIRRDIPYRMPTEHYHPQYEIYYLVSGDRSIFIHDRIYPIEAGDLVLFSPDIIHRSLPASSSAHERMLIEFDLSFFEDFLSLPSGIPYMKIFENEQKVFRPNQAEKQRILTGFQQIISETQKRSPSQDFQLKNLFLSFLQTLYTIVSALPLTSYVSNRKTHEHIREITQYINDNYKNNIGLATVAMHFKQSAEHLSRTFHQTTGFTFTAYLNQLRIREAQQLLSSTKDSIETIAIRTGFMSSTHFGRVFRSQLGISPHQYRKSLR